MKYLLAIFLVLMSSLAIAAPIAINLAGLVNLVIYILVLAAVVWLLLFIVGKWAPPEPVNRFLPAVIYTVAALLLIGLLLDFVGYPLVTIK